MSSGSQHVPNAPYDLAIIGAGGAGLTFLHALTQALVQHPHRTVRLLISDDVRRLTNPVNDRTWCFWDTEPNIADPAACARWDRVQFRRPGGQLTRTMQGHQYRMVQSADYYRLVAAAVKATAGQLTIDWVPACVAVHPAVNGAQYATVVGPDRQDHAHWVLDSRPQAIPESATTLWQHFTGHYVRTTEPVFHPEQFTMMDWRTRQPTAGVSFGYVLPLDARNALVEYTEFTPEVAAPEHREQQLAHYLKHTLGIGADATCVHQETGVIPMTDAPPRQATGQIVPLGVTAGAARPATGYAFTALQRAAHTLVQQWLYHQPLVTPRWYPQRHRAMDALLLHGLTHGQIHGAQFLQDLFTNNPIDRVLTYLDGRSTFVQDLAVMASVPAPPMLHTVFSRLRNPQDNS